MNNPVKFINYERSIMFKFSSLKSDSLDINAYNERPNNVLKIE